MSNKVAPQDKSKSDGPKEENFSMVKAMFKKYDKDGNGQIDMEEFKSLCFGLGYFLLDAEIEIQMKLFL